MNIPKTLICLFAAYFLTACSPAQQSKIQAPIEGPVSALKTGSERTEAYFDLIRNKRIAIVANQTSTIGRVHIVDSLLHAGFNVIKVFAPEHGFRGDAAAGESIRDGKDQSTGLPVISLYGNNKRPNEIMLRDVDVIIFDIQDVGARFYTYISTMHYVMDAAAEFGKEILILDRPNPNGHYIDGPTLEPSFKSFVGMHPIPIVHGLTIGELARMILGEKWLEHDNCQLNVIPCSGYDHKTRYLLPIQPSPNLPNMTAVYLYPSLCWFEGTVISVGRGTALPYQLAGFPDMREYSIKLTPKDIPHVATDPPFEGQETRFRTPADGKDLAHFDISWLQDMYDQYPNKSDFFSSPKFFDKLAGTDQVRKKLEEGGRLTELRADWDQDIQNFKVRRKLYLLYPDFE